LKQELEINYSKFNEEQLCHYNEIIESYKNENKTQLFFISGSGGTGRLFYTTQFWQKSAQKIILL